MPASKAYFDVRVSKHYVPVDFVFVPVDSVAVHSGYKYKTCLPLHVCTLQTRGAEVYSTGQPNRLIPHMTSVLLPFND